MTDMRIAATRLRDDQGNELLVEVHRVNGTAVLTMDFSGHVAIAPSADQARELRQWLDSWERLVTDVEAKRRRFVGRAEQLWIQRDDEALCADYRGDHAWLSCASSDAWNGHLNEDRHEHYFRLDVAASRALRDALDHAEMAMRCHEANRRAA